MPPMTTSVGSRYGPPVSFTITIRARSLCSQLRSLFPDASLPNVDSQPFRIVLAYLDGDESLAVFAGYADNEDFLALFAQTWALAARLGLPTMQNKLIAVMADIYKASVERGDGEQYSADKHLLYAFNHLWEQVGRNSHAEKFLICAVGRAAPLIRELKHQLNINQYDVEMKKNILKEARSFSQDPITYRPGLFRVSIENPPQYLPLEVRRYRHLIETRPRRVARLHSESLLSLSSDISQPPQYVDTTNNRRSELRQPPRPYIHTQMPTAPSEFDDYVSQSSDFQASHSRIVHQDRAERIGNREPPAYRSTEDAYCKTGNTPRIIQILQHNGNSNHTHVSANTINAQGRRRRTRASGSGKHAHHRRSEETEKKEKKGKEGHRYGWISLLVCGSLHL